MQNYHGDVKELSLDFTVTEESFGTRRVIELKSGGKDISVTNDNKMQYIHAMADYKLNQQVLLSLTAVKGKLYSLLYHGTYNICNNVEIADTAFFKFIL